MAQGSRQIQSQAQQQIQTLSPQQILVVKLLELPAVELEDRVHAELLENPALEEGKEESTSDETTPAETSEGETEGDTDYDSLSDYLTEDDIPDYKLQENNRSKEDRAEDIPFVRLGFPILDRSVHSYFPVVGYRGAMRLIEMISGALLDRADRDAKDEDFELVM